MQPFLIYIILDGISFDEIVRMKMSIELWGVSLFLLIEMDTPQLPVGTTILRSRRIPALTCDSLWRQMQR